MPRRGRRRRLVAAGVGFGALAALALGTALLVSRSGGSATEADEDATSLATVEQGRLSAQIYVGGTLGYAARPDGSPFTVVNHATGTYTVLPAAGDTIRCGDVLYRVSNEPVLLLCGRTPAYRSLVAGMSGPDVRELNRNLVRLGYASGSELDPGSDEFGAATAVALSELQEDYELAATGALELGAAVFIPGPLRITETVATLGTSARPGEPLARATSRKRRVEVELTASQRAEVEVGDRAEITLPDNRTTPGVVGRIGVAAGSASGSGTSTEAGSSETGGETIPVYVDLERPGDARALDEAPVEVQITTERVAEALSVPVTALVARAGGGYAVEVVASGGSHELVPVEVGMFDQANGLVEVNGDVAVGDRVVVPAA